MGFSESRRYYLGRIRKPDNEVFRRYQKTNLVMNASKHAGMVVVKPNLDGGVGTNKI